MYWAARFMVGVTLALGLAACEQPQNEVIRGSVFYMERMSIPAESIVNIELLDVSRADAAAKLISSVQVPGLDGSPFHFQLVFDRKEIKEDRRYGLQATVKAHGKLLFSSTEYVEPFSKKQPAIRVMRTPAEQAVVPVDSVLEGVRWGLSKLGDSAAVGGSDQNPVSLEFNLKTRQASGYAGCNRFSGSYSRAGDADQSGELTFSTLATTMKACAEGVEEERLFLRSLGGTRAFEQQGESLVLLDTDGEELMVLKPLD